jgi:CheY-like chemotaxis protein
MAAPPSFTVLLVEDEEDDALLITRLLREAARAVERASCLADAGSRLARPGIDVVLLDLHLPDSAGTAGVQRLLRSHPDLPIVVLTGLDDEAVGQRAVEEGAQDFLVKGQVDRRVLDRSLRYAMERKRAERALARLAAIVSGLCDECGQKLAPRTRGAGSLKN